MKKILLTILFLFPFTLHAATLRFDPTEKQVGSGDVFVATIRIDTDEAECVNAVSASINYPKDVFRLNTISRGESIFTLWVEENVNHELGQINFTSGIPAGYCGRSSGDPGNTNIVGKLIFQYIANDGTPDSVISFMPETEVILNDGLGTKADLRLENLIVKNTISGSRKNEWLPLVNTDKFSPEPFTPEIIQDTTLSDKPYILVFDTTDKQSGVSHYEVVEEDPRSFGFRFGSRIKAKLSISKSPYILQDQTLSSRIVVRAYDHAGNYEESILPPRNMPPIFDPYRYEDYILPTILFFICLIIISIIVHRRNKNRVNKNYSEEESMESLE